MLLSTVAPLQVARRRYILVVTLAVCVCKVVSVQRLTTNQHTRSSQLTALYHCSAVAAERHQSSNQSLSCGSTSHSTQNRSFRIWFPEPICWLDIAKTKPNTSKAHIHQSKEMYYNTNTHTHTFNGPFSGTTWVSRYQKSKTNLDFTEARDLSLIHI